MWQIKKPWTLNLLYHTEMSARLLVDHSYWKSLQAAETRNARCHLLGCKHADANHDARPLEEFLSVDFPRYPGRLDSSWGKNR